MTESTKDLLTEKVRTCHIDDMVVLSIGRAEDEKYRAHVHIESLTISSRPETVTACEHFIDAAVDAIIKGLTYPDNTPVKWLKPYWSPHQYDHTIRVALFSVSY